VLVFSDLVGLGEGRMARFVKRYAEVDSIMVQAVSSFAADVRARRYPEQTHTYHMPDPEAARMADRLRR
jgi:3-methyl-2-oxobutanoate hydroxymethyltransferase